VSAADFDTLRRIAENADADGRPWEWQGGYPQRIVRVGDGVVVADMVGRLARFAEHIATFDPPTVLALLAENERLRDENKRLRATEAVFAELGPEHAALAAALARLDQKERP
jgi:hypothetical protein